MKKVLSVLLAAVLSAPLPVYDISSAYAQGDALDAYAAQCGADTDCFSFPNFQRLIPANSRNPQYAEFLKRCSFPEASREPAELYSGALATGRCMGLSILSILAHNGVITAGDIQSGAEHIADVVLNEETDAFLSHYQAVQGYNYFDLYMKWFVSRHEPQETVRILIDTAEKAAKENKYFLVVHNSHVITHAVTAMGIIDGSWEFKDRSYDKCIPVYDTNLSDGNGNAIGFSPSASIYINSADLTAYIPFYEVSTDVDLSLFVTDDMGFMNYKGLFPDPENTAASSIPDITRIELDGSGYTASAERSDGSEYDPLSGNLKFRTNRGRAAYCDGEKFTISCGNDCKNVSFTDSSAIYTISSDGKMTEAVKDGSSVYLNGDNTEYRLSALFSQDACSFAPHCRYTLSGIADGRISMQKAEDGIIFCGDNGVKGTLQTSDAVYDSDTALPKLSENQHTMKLCSSGSVRAAFSKDDQLTLYIDKYNDGSYSCPVQKGDVDCSGMIDAADATDVLASYSAVSVGGTGFVDLSLGDMDSDGTLDAADATDILAIYADLST